MMIFPANGPYAGTYAGPLASTHDGVGAEGVLAEATVTDPPLSALTIALAASSAAAFGATGAKFVGVSPRAALGSAVGAAAAAAAIGTFLSLASDAPLAVSSGGESNPPDESIQSPEGISIALILYEGGSVVTYALSGALNAQASLSHTHFTPPTPPATPPYDSHPIRRHRIGFLILSPLNAQDDYAEASTRSGHQRLLSWAVPLLALLILAIVILSALLLWITLARGSQETVRRTAATLLHSLMLYPSVALRAVLRLATSLALGPLLAAAVFLWPQLRRAEVPPGEETDADQNPRTPTIERAALRRGRTNGEAGRTPPRTPPQAVRTPPQAVRTPPQAVRTPPQAVRTPPQAVRTPPQAVRTPPPASGSPAAIGPLATVGGAYMAFPIAGPPAVHRSASEPASAVTHRSPTHPNLALPLPRPLPPHRPSQGFIAAEVDAALAGAGRAGEGGGGDAQGGAQGGTARDAARDTRGDAGGWAARRSPQEGLGAPPIDSSMIEPPPAEPSPIDPPAISGARASDGATDELVHQIGAQRCAQAAPDTGGTLSPRSRLSRLFVRNRRQPPVLFAGAEPPARVRRIERL